VGLSFPVMTLAKSAKIVPIVVGQLLIGESSYGVRDFLFAGLLVSGTVLLSLGSSKGHHGDDHSSTMGVAFVLISLVMDGCTGCLQKQLKLDAAAAPPTTYDFLLFTHVSMLAISMVVSLASGDLFRGLSFLQENHLVAALVVQLCGLSVIGQSFIFYVVANFDPVVCATVTTTRKMWSVLLSMTMFHHQLTATGYSGLALALAGLGVEVQAKKFAKKAATNDAQVK